MSLCSETSGACLDLSGMVTLWLSTPTPSLCLHKRKPRLGNDYARPEGVNVSRCDMDRERVSSIAGLCLTAGLATWLVWQELEVMVKRALRVQNELAVSGAGALRPFLASLPGVEGFQRCDCGWKLLEER